MKDPKQVAKELVDKHYAEMFSPNTCDYCFECEGKQCDKMKSAAKDCAIITVDEILGLKMIYSMGGNGGLYLSEGEFWEKVKKQIIEMPC